MASQATPAKIVLVDLDDTLVYRGDHNARAMKATLRDFGHEVSLEEIAACTDETALLKKYPCDWIAFWRHFDVHDNRAVGLARGDIAPYHDAHAFLHEAVSSGADVIIVTDTVPHKSTFEIEAFEFGPYLKGSVIYELDKPGIEPKPDVSVATRALDLLNYTPRHVGTLDMLPSNEEMDHIWVVGDSGKDMQLAENLKRHFSTKGIHTLVHSILIERRPSGPIKADYVPFGPHPLYTAGRLIRDHGRCTYPLITSPEACAPDITPNRIEYPGDEYGGYDDVSPRPIPHHKTRATLINKGFTRPYSR